MTFHNSQVSRPEPDTASARDPEGVEGTVLALYVTGPNGGARHVLPSGLVTLGRGADATISVDDPRVSRSHAVLHVTEHVMLSDLGSANGTFLGSERLAVGDARRLSDGQSFFIGDSALVVRPCALRPPGAQRLTSIERVRGRFGGELDSLCGSVASIRVRPMGSPRPRSLEAVLAEVLQSPRDFMLWLDGETLALGIETRAEASASRVERDVIEKLASFSITADVSARVLPVEELERAGEAAFAIVSGSAPLELLRGKIVLEDPAMQALERAVRRVAKTSVSVLVLGETGSGKDVVAAMLHEFSPRAELPFVALNCANLPEPLLESELFGYERGAFTGAVSAKLGLLEAARGGTVFLDEIGDLPLPLQAKLLRVIETHEVTRLGALKPCAVDVRFVAATNRDLERDIASGRFRQDLYYRLNGVALTVPPLRERPGEIEPLARQFLESARERFETGEVCFSPAALAALGAYAWPGNVRQLKSAVERAALLAQAELIEPSDLGLTRPDAALRSPPPRGPATEPLILADGERERIVRALEEYAGNQSRAARLLGVSRRTLVRKIAELGLPRPRGNGRAES